MSQHPPDLPEEERLPQGRLLAAGAAVLLVSALAVWRADAILRDQTRSLRPGGEAPAPRAGAEEIGLVEQRMYELGRRGERRRREQLQQLGSYGWVDRDAGVIHIPVTRAMDEVVRELAGGPRP